MQSAHAPRTRRLAGLVLCLAVGALVALPAHAQWKWKDAAGNVQYSDRPPPPGTPDKDILQRPPGQEIRVVQWQNGQVVSSAASAAAPNAAATAASQAASAAKVAADAKRLQDAQAKQKAEEARIAEAHRANCEQAQANARLLASGQRVALPNAQGENIFIDDTQRAAELQRAQAAIASECSQ